MKRNDFVDIKNLDQKGLLDKVKLLRGEIADLILDKNMNKLKDLKVIFKKRKDLAQVLTVIRQKEMLSLLEVLKKGDESDGGDQGKGKTKKGEKES